MKRLFLFVLPVVCCFVIISCKNKPKNHPDETTTSLESVVKAKKKSLKIVRQFPHPGDRLYTQGFEIENGILYESTGLDDRSSLKKIDLKTGKLIVQKNLKGQFGEGLTLFNGFITMLTYKNGKAFTYNKDDLSERELVHLYSQEGWGLTHDSVNLIMSDGSDRLFFRDPMTFRVLNTVNVTFNGYPLQYINELEYVNGMVYANVYGSSQIVVINPKTGIVEEVIDASMLDCSQNAQVNPENVLNGIAYNPESKTFFITGKMCSNIYEVTFE